MARLDVRMAATDGSGPPTLRQAPPASSSSNLMNAALGAALQQMEQQRAHNAEESTKNVRPRHGRISPLVSEISNTTKISGISEAGAKFPERGRIFGSIFSVDEEGTEIEERVAGRNILERASCGFKNIFEFDNSMPNWFDEWVAPVLERFGFEDPFGTVDADKLPPMLNSALWQETISGGATGGSLGSAATNVQQLDAHRQVHDPFQPAQYDFGYRSEQHQQQSASLQQMGAADNKHHPIQELRSSLPVERFPKTESESLACGVARPVQQRCVTETRQQQSPNLGAPPFQEYSPQTQPESLAPAMAVGPLGVPVPARARGPSMGAIQELPHHLNSATYDDLSDSKVSEALGTKHTMSGAGLDLPDPLSVGLQVYRDVVASSWGLGRIARGSVGADHRGIPVLVSEVRVPKPLDSSQLKRINAALRISIFSDSREDVSQSLGAVPAHLENNTPGVWMAWSDPAGAVGGAAKPLKDALQSTPQDPGWRLKIARQICTAMAALHQAGRSHGSFGPRSVIVGSSGDVCIIEAGLVDALIGVGVLHEHDLLSYLGLEFARYLAPEGWQMPRQAGAASDIWALGLVLLEVLGGAEPPNSECSNLQQLSAKLLPKRGQHAVLVTRDGAFGALPPLARRTVEACFSSSPAARPEALQVLFSLAAPDSDTLHPAVSALAETSAASGEKPVVLTPTPSLASPGEAPEVPRTKSSENNLVPVTSREKSWPSLVGSTAAPMKEAGLKVQRYESWPPMHEPETGGGSRLARASRGAPPPPPAAPPAFDK